MEVIRRIGRSIGDIYIHGKPSDFRSVYVRPFIAESVFDARKRWNQATDSWREEIGVLQGHRIDIFLNSLPEDAQQTLKERKVSKHIFPTVNSDVREEHAGIRLVSYETSRTDLALGHVAENVVRLLTRGSDAFVHKIVHDPYNPHSLSARTDKKEGEYHLFVTDQDNHPWIVYIEQKKRSVGVTLFPGIDTRIKEEQNKRRVEKAQQRIRDEYKAIRSRLPRQIETNYQVKQSQKIYDREYEDLKEAEFINCVISSDSWTRVQQEDMRAMYVAHGIDPKAEDVVAIYSHTGDIQAWPFLSDTVLLAAREKEGALSVRLQVSQNLKDQLRREFIESNQRSLRAHIHQTIKSARKEDNRGKAISLSPRDVLKSYVNAKYPSYSILAPITREPTSWQQQAQKDLLPTYAQCMIDILGEEYPDIAAFFALYKSAAEKGESMNVQPPGVIHPAGGENIGISLDFENPYGLNVQYSYTT